MSIYTTAAQRLPAERLIDRALAAAGHSRTERREMIASCKAFLRDPARRAAYLRESPPPAASLPDRATLAEFIAAMSR